MTPWWSFVIKPQSADHCYDIIQDKHGSDWKHLVHHSQPTVRLGSNGKSIGSIFRRFSKKCANVWLNFLQVCFRSNHSVFNLQSSCPLSNEILSGRCKVPSIMFHFTIRPSGSNFNWKTLQLRIVESKHFWPKILGLVWKWLFVFLDFFLSHLMHNFSVTEFVNVFA